MAYWHLYSPLGWPGFHPHRCRLSPFLLPFSTWAWNVDAADVLNILQAAAVTFLVWLLLGGLHTLYLVYATGWRDFQIVIR